MYCCDDMQQTGALAGNTLRIRTFCFMNMFILTCVQNPVNPKRPEAVFPDVLIKVSFRAPVSRLLSATLRQNGVGREYLRRSGCSHPDSLR